MDIQFKKVVDKRIVMPNGDPENSRIIISYKSEEVTPPADEITISGLKEQIKRIDDNVDKLLIMRAKIIATLDEINQDESIPVTTEIPAPFVDKL